MENFINGNAKIESRRQVITPDLASKMLLSNTCNRPVMKAHVRMLRNVIERGEFIFNGEPIIVANSGRLLDGQHRLMACLESGIPIDALIVTGVKESAFATIDQGKIRTCGSVMQMAGETNANRLSAAVRYCFTFCRYGQIYDASYTPGVSFTPTVAFKFLNAAPGIRESVAATYCPKYPSQSLLGALHFVFSMVNPGVADEMAEVISNGSPELNRGFNVLREHIIACRMNGTKIGPRAIAAKTIRAFNAEVLGREVKVIKYMKDAAFPTVDGLDYEKLLLLSDV